jgi:hypothetical protein
VAANWANCGLSSSWFTSLAVIPLCASTARSSVVTQIVNKPWQHFSHAASGQGNAKISRLVIITVSPSEPIVCSHGDTAILRTDERFRKMEMDGIY